VSLSSRGDDIIAASHHGPILTYIAAYTDSDGSGPIWTKIAEEGLEHSSTTWAVDRLIANRGRWPVTLPSSLQPSRYLLRQEIIALHEADAVYSQNPVRGAQFYPSCIQIEVTSGGSGSVPGGFDVNQYSETDPGIHFSLYQCAGGSYGCFPEYPIPGPDVWSG
jgi:cellulase